MARPKDPPPSDQEVAAIKQAEAQWLDWRAMSTVLPPDIPDGRAFAQLNAATKQMQAAIELFVNHSGSREMARLVATMQELQLFRSPQGDYRDMIDGLAEPLQLLANACDSIIGGPGKKSDPNVLAWVGLCATAWVQHGNPAPTAKGRFFRAITEVKVEVDLERDLTEDQVKTALLKWAAVGKFTAS
jgi:hypothetical protein